MRCGGLKRFLTKKKFLPKDQITMAGGKKFKIAANKY
jgi:hypothetical protein